MDKNEAMLGYLRGLAAFLEIQARDYELGKTRHFTEAIDDSADTAAGLRHKARNVMTLVACYGRLTDRDR
jgi:hypothetical protein